MNFNIFLYKTLKLKENTDFEILNMFENFMSDISNLMDTLDNYSKINYFQH